TQLTEGLEAAFYEKHSFGGISVLDPFMGSGVTIGEAHKLGFTALGRDINPVSAISVKVALGPMSKDALHPAFEQLCDTVGESLRAMYRSTDRREIPCEVLYYFWVMTAPCPSCSLT